MNIYAINPTMNLYKDKPLVNTNSPKNKLVQQNYINNYSILNNYNRAGINFKGINFLEKTICEWIEKNNINEKTINSFKNIQITQKDNITLMKKLKSVIPIISTTSFSTWHFVDNPEDSNMNYITQSLQLNKKGKKIGTYSVSYDLNGNIVDDYLAIK